MCTEPPRRSSTEPRWPAPTPEVVGIDISGRHEEDDAYRMVAAAVHATVDSTRIRSVHGIGLATASVEPTLEATVRLTAAAVADLPTPPECPVVAERGEFYEEPATRVAVNFSTEFKYVESIGERETVQAAHHAAYAARGLLL